MKQRILLSIFSFIAFFSTGLAALPHLDVEHVQWQVFDEMSGGRLQTFYNSESGFVLFQYCKLRDYAKEHCDSLTETELRHDDLSYYQQAVISAILKTIGEIGGEGREREVLDQMLADVKRMGLKLWILPRSADMKEGAVFTIKSPSFLEHLSKNLSATLVEVQNQIEG
ncbi:MAG: hypothetical protein AB7G93_15095 [Bdellovibrionales bacterium]